MASSLLLAIAIVICAFAYRLRGGGFFKFNGDFFPRLIWGGALTVAYLVLQNFNINWMYLAIIGGTGFVSMFVPHAYCQNMGRWPTPQKRWPSFFLPLPTLQTWQTEKLIDKTAYDMLQMACVCMIRSAIIFGPFALLTASPFHALLAGGIVSIASPLAYAIGYYVPFSLPSLPKNDAAWGELLTGVMYAVALSVI